MLVNETANKYKEEMGRLLNLSSLPKIFVDFSKELDLINDDVIGREIIEVIVANYFTATEIDLNNTLILTDDKIEDMKNIIKDNVKNLNVSDKVLSEVIMSILNKLNQLEAALDVYSFIPYQWLGDNLLIVFIQINTTLK